MSEECEASAPTSSGADATSGKHCVRCERAIETSEWYPISTDRDTDGTLQLYAFCSEDCQATWLEERAE